MHQWCTRTCLKSTIERSEALRDMVAQEAVCHSFLMDGLLAFTASDVQHTAEAAKQLSQALQYQNLGLAELGDVLPHISRDNCDAVPLAFVFNMLCALLTPLVLVQKSLIHPWSLTPM